MSASVATSPTLREWNKSSAYLDWLQMLSGASLIIFMWTHLCLVSSVLVGPHVMNVVAGFFERTGLVFVIGPAIFCVFLVHFIMAARKIPFATQQQGAMWANAKRMRHTDTWLWVVQAASAMVILIMGAAHMWVVLTDLPITAAKSAARIQSGAWLIFYLILLPMVELHVGIGLYRIAVKWGFLNRENRRGFHLSENILTAGLIGIGLLTLARFMFLR